MRNRDLMEKYADLVCPDFEDKAKSCMYWGFDVPDEWIGIVREFLEKCAESKRNFPNDWEGVFITQCKQKWGKLTIYHDGSNHDFEVFLRHAQKQVSELDS